MFQDLPLLPTPLGTFIYTKFKRLPLSDRLSALPLLYSLIDFDNSDEAWQRYDSVKARELFKQYGVTKRLYDDAFNAMLLVGLFAPGEQCSAAAALGMLYYFILAHQPNFDVVWCRGTVGEMIFKPWVENIESLGGQVLTKQRVTDLIVDDDGKAKGVVCEDHIFEADAVIFAVGISGMKKILAGSEALQNRQEFRNVNNLGGVDVLGIRLWFERKIPMPRASNACFGFDATTGWTFFDLNALHEGFRDEPGTVLEVDFYHANQFLPLSDEEIIKIVRRYLATCIPEFRAAEIIDQSVVRVREGVTHFFPGSYQYLLPAKVSFENVFMSGDWIINRHGSWSQEKAYVTGLEAANLVVDKFKLGEKANIIPVEEDEEHIKFARTINKSLREVGKSIFPDIWL